MTWNTLLVPGCDSHSPGKGWGCTESQGAQKIPEKSQQHGQECSEPPGRGCDLRPALKHQLLPNTSSQNTPNKWGVEFVLHRRCCLNTEKQLTGQKCNMQQVPKYSWNFSLFRDSLIFACRAFIWSITALYLQILLHSSAINTWIFCFMRLE